ncbi:MAG: stalk domain-containing protein [Candidatus Bathyarchaeales archaeon]
MRKAALIASAALAIAVVAAVYIAYKPAPTSTPALSSTPTPTPTQAYTPTPALTPTPTYTQTPTPTPELTPTPSTIPSSTSTPAPTPASGFTRAKEIRFIVGERRYFVDGEERLMDAPAILIGEQICVPVKYLAEAMGTQWSYNQERISLLFPDWGRVAELFVERPVMIVCGEEMQIPVAPVVRENQIYLPAKFVAEAFRYTVDWNPATQTISISTTQSCRLTFTIRPRSSVEKLWAPIPRAWDGEGMTNVKVIDFPATR